MSSPDSPDASLVKALGHPLRLRLLELITERGEASPVELARSLEQPLATVSHHFRVLRELGSIELTRTEPRRGAVEHFYRPVVLPFLSDEEWERLPVALRRGLAGQTFRRIFAEGSAAGASGGFDPPGAHVDRLPLALDEAGWRELSELLVTVLEQARSIQERSDRRRAADADGQTAVRPSRLAILHFAQPGDVTPTAPEPARRGRRARSPRSR